jgi:hypothetical protein
MRIGRLELKDKPTLAEIARVDLLLEELRQVLPKKIKWLNLPKVYFKVKWYNKRVLQLLVKNKVWFFDLRHLTEVLKKQGLLNDSNEYSQNKYSDAIKDIVSFFSVRLKKTPKEVETGFRQDDVLTVYNQIISQDINHYMKLLMIQHDAKGAIDILKKMKRQIKKNGTNRQIQNSTNSEVKNFKLIKKYGLSDRETI